MGEQIIPDNLNSVYAEIAELIGIEDTCKLYEHFRGQQILFPQKLYNVKYIRAYIADNYDGSNLRLLSRKFGYSERSIRRFLKSKMELEDVKK